MKTFKEFDKLSLEPFADQLLSFIETDKHFVEEALIISLNGSFGSGKSTFFEMLENKLNGDAKFDMIKLNAWESDFQEDALLAIIYNLVKHLEARGISSNTETLKQVAGKVGKMALSVGNDIANKFIGVDIKKAGKEAEGRKPELLGKACFEVYKDRYEAFSVLKDLIREAIKSAEKPIVIVVDELDRCRPDYAVEYLETIKHIFDIEGLIFILGVDKKSLESSVKCLFGSTLNFDEYYRKFAHRNISLPTPDEQTLARFTLDLYKQYITEPSSGGRFTFGKDHNYKVDQFNEFIKDFLVTPRQLHEIMRLTAHALVCSEKSSGRMLWGWNVGTMVMSILSVIDSELYHAIGAGKITLDEFTEIMKTKKSLLSVGSDNLWWMYLLYYGIFDKNTINVDSYTKEVKALGLYDPEWGEDYIKKRVGELWKAYDEWGHSINSPYRSIYNTLETCKRFAD